MFLFLKQKVNLSQSQNKQLKMKNKIKFIIKFLSTFGLTKGTFLYFKFAFGNVNNIKVPTLTNSISLRKGTSDVPTFYQVFLDEQYHVLSKYKSAKVVIDAGANIGLFALKIHSSIPDAVIICLEPDKSNFDLLTKNIIKYPKIKAINCGLWNKDTKLRVYDKYDYGNWGFVVEEDLLSGTISALTIDTIMNQNQLSEIDILKIDIETSEKQLFSSNYQEWLPKVKVILIEFHDWLEKGCSKPFFVAINECFEEYEFSISGENIIIENLKY